MTATRTMRTVLGTAATAALAATGLALVASPAEATHGALPPGRTLLPYTVQDGDTATGLAVRYTAWTNELISYNHLNPDAGLRVGQQIVIPQVTERLAQKAAAAAPAPAAPPAPLANAATWQHADPARAQVRDAIVRTAQQHGVDPHLALAISWQESGWQMHHVSWAQAIGAMQVLPGTGTWMSLYAKRPLDLNNLDDNALAGVLLLKVLLQQTGDEHQQVAAYYQGLGSVRKRGVYAETERYVANVQAIRAKLDQGWNPA